jgi:hypothetical protein
MPSWSWAATGSAKIWPPEGTSIWTSACRAEELPEQLSIIPSGHLQIRIHLSTIQSAPSYVKDEFTARDSKLGGLKYVWGDSWDLSPKGFYLQTQDTNGGYDKAVLGLSRFDDDRTTTYTHACLLAKKNNRSEEPGAQLKGKQCVKVEFIVRFASDQLSEKIKHY